MGKIKSGDFSVLAKNYINRPAYCPRIIRAILKYTDLLGKKGVKVCDVGAGTGKLTKVLLEQGLAVDAVEPNREMFSEGKKYTAGMKKIKWSLGSAEDTGKKTRAYSWVTMGSSFHWTDPEKSLPELARILKLGGYVTLIWNPRNVQASELQTGVENLIYKMVPDLKRKSSGAEKHTKSWSDVLISTGHFTDVIFMETDYIEVMDKERYMGVWRSVNDIRAQAGEKKFKQILAEIESLIKGLDKIVMPYKIRAWTAVKK